MKKMATMPPTKSYQDFKVSLIMTTYNRPDALQLVLKSVALQSLIPHELIVADDGSGLPTLQVVEDYRKILDVPMQHVWQEDRGFRASKIRNKATAAARGDYLIFIDGDMVMHPEFVASHVRAARPGQFIQGSRVLLSEATTARMIREWRTTVSFFEKGIQNRFNTLNSPLLSPLFSRFQNDIRGVRSCNMAFWKSDLILVNGFNEDFEGWGREDSELVVRLLNAGIRRRNLKGGGVAYHLAHPDNSRSNFQRNDEMLSHAIRERVNYCPNGLSQYLTAGAPA